MLCCFWTLNHWLPHLLGQALSSLTISHPVECTSSALLECLLKDHTPVCAFQFKGCPRQAVVNGFLATKTRCPAVLGSLSGHSNHEEIVSPISESDSSALCYPDDDGRVRLVFLP